MMKAGRALTRSGNKVVIQDRSNSNDQVFIRDSKNDHIEPAAERSVSLDIADAGKNRYLVFDNEKDFWSQKFKLIGKRLVNERNLVLDVAGGKDVDN